MDHTLQAQTFLLQSRTGTYPAGKHEAANLSQLRSCTKAIWAISPARQSGQWGLVTSSVMLVKSPHLKAHHPVRSLKQQQQQQYLRERTWSLGVSDYKVWETLKNSCTQIWMWCSSSVITVFILNWSLLPTYFFIFPLFEGSADLPNAMKNIGTFNQCWFPEEKALGDSI